MKEWIEALKGSMEKADGQKKKYTYLARHSPDFYKSRHVLHEEFIKSANSGDILLFKSQHSAARLQRVFTDSEYGKFFVNKIMLVLCSEIQKTKSLFMKAPQVKALVLLHGLK